MLFHRLFLMWRKPRGLIFWRLKQLCETSRGTQSGKIPFLGYGVVFFFWGGGSWCWSVFTSSCLGNLLLRNSTLYCCFILKISVVLCFFQCIHFTKKHLFRNIKWDLALNQLFLKCSLYMCAHTLRNLCVPVQGNIPGNINIF